MLKGISITSLLCGWLAAVALIVAGSVAVDARLSTTALLFMMGVAPAVVAGLIRGGAEPAPSVAEILHPISAKDGR